MAMAFRLGALNLNAVAQGVGGLVFGNGDRHVEEDDGGVEQYLERISNGVLADDRRAAMAELQNAVAESQAAQLAFGTMGFPILMSVLREEREDLDMVRGALETLINALSTAPNNYEENNDVQPGLVNSELFSREPGSVPLILSLLDEEDFYVRFHTLQLLTALLTNCPERLQEVILATPHGITRLMNMLLDLEIIRNEALLLLTYLTREAEEIQKIVVFEGAFERIFTIVREEGAAEGGIIVQDCLELLNNLLRNNPSNQIFLRETLGLQQVVSLLKVRNGRADGLTEQKAVNVLCALETVTLLLAGGPNAEPGKDANVVANQTVLAQNQLLDILLALCADGKVSAVAICSSALRCIGDLVVGHPVNRDLLASKAVGDDANSEPALNRILRILLQTPHLSVCIAAEYVFRSFCQGNRDGQTMLASTITPLPQANHRNSKVGNEEKHISFGSMLVRALISSDGRSSLEASCRAASVLSHILKDNVQCKERVLRIPLEIPASALAPPDLLMPRCLRFLAEAAPTSLYNAPAQTGQVWLQPVILRLLVTWLADCPSAVSAFLEPTAHLPYLVELTSSQGSPASVHVAGLAAVLLGECIVYNDGEGAKDASMVVDVISQRVGLTAYFSKWDQMQKSPLFVSAASVSRLPKPLTRSNAASAAAGDGLVTMLIDKPQLPQNPVGNDGHPEPVVTTFYDAEFVAAIRTLEPLVRERIVELFAHPKSRANVEVQGFDRKEGEQDKDYIERLRSALRSQTQELQDLLERNSALAGDLLVSSSGGEDSGGAGDEALKANLASKRGSLRGPGDSFLSKTEAETLKQQLLEYQHAAEEANKEKQQAESEVVSYKQLLAKQEADLQSLSAAYNSLEHDNYILEGEVKKLRKALEDGGISLGLSEEQLQAAREEGRQEAIKDSEADLSDLMVCLGQEESKVEKLRERLEELGEDVEALLQGIGEPEPDGDREDDG